MVTVSIFGVIVIIFVLHTVLTHLINWLWRECDGEIVVLALVVTIVELLLTLILLKYYIT